MMVAELGGVGGKGNLPVYRNLTGLNLARKIGIKWIRETGAMVQEWKFALGHFKELYRLMPDKVEEIVLNANVRMRDEINKCLKQGNYTERQVLTFPVEFLSLQEARSLAKLFGPDFIAVGCGAYDPHHRGNVKEDLLEAQRLHNRDYADEGFFLGKIF